MKSLWRSGCLGQMLAVIIGTIAVGVVIGVVYAVAILAIRTWAVIGIPVAILLGAAFYFFLPVRLWFSQKLPQFAEQIVLNKSPVAIGLSTVLAVSSLVAVQVNKSLPVADSTTTSSSRSAASLPSKAPAVIVTVQVSTQIPTTRAPNAVALMQAIPTQVVPTASAVPTLLAPTPTLVEPATALVEQAPAQPTEAAPTDAPVNVSLTPQVTAPQTVKLRSGPGPNYKVTGSIKAGVTVDVVGRNEDGTWLLIDMGANHIRAWVSRHFVNATGQLELVAVMSAPAPPVVVKVAPIQVESAPVQAAVEPNAPAVAESVIEQPVAAQPVQPEPITPEPAGFISQPASAPVVQAVDVPNQCVGQPSGARYGAICKDDWRSDATRQGACSSHGGVKVWLTCS